MHHCRGRREPRPAAAAPRRPRAHAPLGLIDVLGESLLLTRNRAGELRAFYNVCRHRGTRLCRDPSDPPPAAALPGGIAGGRITCPYHQWTYDFDGHLLAAPHLSGEPGFDRSQFSLYPAAVEEHAMLDDPRFEEALFRMVWALVWRP